MHKHLANTLRTTWCRHGLSVVQTISGVLWPRPRCWCLGTETSAEQSLATSRQVTAACEALGKPPPWKHEIGRTTRTNNNLQVFSVQDLNLLVSLVSNLIELIRMFFWTKWHRGCKNVCVCVCSSVNWYGQVTQSSIAGSITPPGRKEMHQEIHLAPYAQCPQTQQSGCLSELSSEAFHRYLTEMSVMTNQGRKMSPMSPAFSFSPLQSSNSNSWRVWRVKSSETVLHGPAWGQVLLEKQRFLSYCVPTCGTAETHILVS